MIAVSTAGGMKRIALSTAGGAVTVFEGFTDYLSALAYYRKTEADTPVIVLGAAGSLQPWEFDH